MNLWERKWSISSGVDDLFLGTGRPTIFELQRKEVDGVPFFHVQFEREQMPAEWNDTSLVERGTAPFKLDGNPLPEFDGTPAVDAEYNARIKAALNKTTTSTRRLEGELDGGLGRKMVHLFMARNAVKVDLQGGSFFLRDLLVLIRATRFTWSDQDLPDSMFMGAPIDDGTAHGNPK